MILKLAVQVAQARVSPLGPCRALAGFRGLGNRACYTLLTTIPT
jgi:hypothetical protein